MVSRMGRRWRLNFVALLALCWMVGMVDTFGYHRFGVFTSNMAGNLVLLADDPGHNVAQAQLAAAALGGALLGVIAGALLMRLRPLPGPSRCLAPLVLGTLLLAGSLIATTGPDAPIALVPVISGAVACIATGWSGMTPTKVWISANTGAYLGSVDGLFARIFGGRAAPLRPGTRTAIVMTVGFVAGVATFGSGVLAAPHPLLWALVPPIVVIGILVLEIVQGGEWFARRDLPEPGAKEPPAGVP